MLSTDVHFHELDPSQKDTLERESVRLCERFINEVVLRLKLCPWARPVVRDRRLQILVITDEFSREKNLSDAISGAHELLQEASRSPEIELVLLTFPRFRGGRLNFDHVLRALRRAHEASGAVGEDRFALAAFHPDATPDDATPERLIPYFRRTPDPTIQAVRTPILNALEPATESGTLLIDLNDIAKFLTETVPVPSLRERVAKANKATLDELGRAQYEDLITDILDDRDRTYARLNAETTP